MSYRQHKNAKVCNVGAADSRFLSNTLGRDDDLLNGNIAK